MTGGPGSGGRPLVLRFIADAGYAEIADTPTISAPEGRNTHRSPLLGRTATRCVPCADAIRRCPVDAHSALEGWRPEPMGGGLCFARWVLRIELHFPFRGSVLPRSSHLIEPARFRLMSTSPYPR
jgi:hypothetical protein